MIGNLQKMETSDEAYEDMGNLLDKLQIDDVSQILIKGVAMQMVYAAMSEVQEEYEKSPAKPDIGRHLANARSKQK
jgi:NH3-dependent NAD+ synthetase